MEFMFYNWELPSWNKFSVVLRMVGRKNFKRFPWNSVLVINHAAYHNRQVKKSPTAAWRKEEMKDWLK